MYYPDGSVQAISSCNPGNMGIKSNFYVLHDTGVLRNRTKIWNSYQDILESGWQEKVCVSSKGETGDKRIYNINAGDIPKLIKK